MKKLIWLTALLGVSCAHRIDPASMRLTGRQDIDITVDKELDTPILVKGTLADLSRIKKQKRPQPLLLFFKENSDIFKLQEPGTELRLLRRDEDELGFTHYRYERVHNGVPIFGDELIVHVNDKSEIYLINGRYHPSLTIKATPAITAEKAGILALEQGRIHKMQSADKSNLVYYPIGDNVRLAYHVILSGGKNRWDYYIDAENGRVLFDQDRRRF
ncbi:hypothetical protein JW935_14015 [candidate division KSB1 bacterium]|nr:hypothetical protein [candidate division KSB1 bacterium]